MNHKNIFYLLLVAIQYSRNARAFLTSPSEKVIARPSTFDPSLLRRKTSKSRPMEKRMLPFSNDHNISPKKIQSLSNTLISTLLLPILLLTHCTNDHISNIASAEEVSPALSSESLYKNTNKNEVITPPPSNALFSLKDIQSQLKAPTEDQPQITLPPSMKKQSLNDKLSSSFTNKVAEQPIVKGFVYLSNDDDVYKINAYESTLVITAQQKQNGDVILGAKIPMAKIRKFPMQFNLYSSNVIQKDEQQKELIYDAIRNDDLFMKALICPSDSVKFPCGDEDSIGMGKGISKIVRNLPGMEKDDTIRAPASMKIEVF